MTKDQQQALAEAEQMLDQTYSPYSEFAVGACLVMDDGTLICGANVENVAYGSTICAERSALLRANAEGKRAYRGIAVIGRDDSGRNRGAGELTAPCGSCRQMLFEFARLSPKDPWVVLCTPDKQRVKVVHLMRDLLPYGFGPANLGCNPHSSP